MDKIWFAMAVGLAIFVCLYAVIDQDPPDDVPQYPIE
jgi:hypothetical protein